MSTIIIYGPQGCGKTRNAQLIAKTFGITSILDGWHGRGSVPEDTLVLTNVQGIEGAQDYYKVMYEIYEHCSPAKILVNKTGWAMLQDEKEQVKFVHYENGAIESSYPFTPKDQAAIFAVAIVNGYEPPRCLRNYDAPTH